MPHTAHPVWPNDWPFDWPKVLWHPYVDEGINSYSVCLNKLKVCFNYANSYFEADIWWVEWNQISDMILRETHRPVFTRAKCKRNRQQNKSLNQHYIRWQTDHSGWVSLALMLLTGPMMDFQWAIALSWAKVAAMIGPELMKAVKLGKKSFPYWSA